MGLLDGKAAIVTGSARGIGRATAELFVSEGAKVLINDLDADVAEQAASEIDGETAVYAGDLTKPEAADKLVAAGVDAFGAVDIVVNNAGYTWDGVAHKMTDEQFQAMLDIHTIVPFRVARALAPHWREAAKAERGEGKEVFRKIDQHLLDLGDDGQRRPGQLLGGEDGRRRPDQNAGQGVGPVQDQRQRGRLRLRRNPPHRRQGGGRRDDLADRREDRARHPRADAGDGLGDHPARPPGHARGGLRPGPLPLPRRWPTTCTARCSTSPAACSGGCTPELHGDRGQAHVPATST